MAGLGWQGHLDQLLEFLATPDYDSAVAWIDAHEGTNTYTFSKQAMNAYVAWQAYPFMAEGIRINSICPGPTDTPLARANGGVASPRTTATQPARAAPARADGRSDVVPEQRGGEWTQGGAVGGLRPRHVFAHGIVRTGQARDRLRDVDVGLSPTS